MTTGSLASSSSDNGDWLDVGDNASLPSLALDDVLNEVDFLDDNLSFLDSCEDNSMIGGPGAALPSTTFSYKTDSALVQCKMDAISHQLATLSTKGGSAQAIAEKNGRIAVGTSKGMLLLFDAQNRLERFVSADESTGPVSCVAFSPDGKVVSVGFGKGSVKVVNVQTGKVLQFLRESVQPGRGVLQILYLDRSQSFLTLDSGGNVFEVRLKSNLVGSKNPQVRCVFSGCNGEVVFMKHLPNHLLALLTVSKVMLVSTRFGGSVLCAFPLKSNLQDLPLFDHAVKEKRFCVCLCRGDILSIFVVHTENLGSQKKAASLIRTMQLPCHAVSLQWIVPSGIVVLDAVGRTFLVDTDKGTVRQSAIQDIQIVFGSAHYKGLSTGGNVSAALRCLAESVCYQTICRRGGSVLVLAHGGIHCISTLTEQEQLALYSSRDDFVSPCLYLLDLLKGKVRPSEQFADKIGGCLHKALISLSVFTSDGCKAGRVADLVYHYKKHISILLHVCFHANMANVLYEEVWPRLERDALSRSVLLESLDDWVLDGRLDGAPPGLLSAYLSHLASEGHFSQLQAAVVRLPIHSIDLHLVMSTCRQNGLYDGIIYVMNKALGDYISPLEEMLQTVGRFAANEVLSDSEVEQGNRLMLYIHCCLAGHSYPFGTLTKELVDSVPLDVFRCITSLKGKDGGFSEQRYPYLRLLLLFDAQQFVHVICTCVDAPLFRSDGRLQRLVEMIGILSVELRTAAALLQFLLLTAQLVDNNHLLAPVDMIEDAVSCLLRLPSSDGSIQTPVIEIMRVVPQINKKNILRLALSPLRPRICSYIYLSERRFVELIRSFAAEDKNTEVFSVIRQILISGLSSAEQTEVLGFVRSLLPSLSSRDPVSCAHLILDFYTDYLAELRSDDRTMRTRSYPVINAAFSIRRERGELFLTGDEDIDESLFGIVFEGRLAAKASENDDERLQDFLSYWLPMGSRTDACLNMASAAGCVATTVMLLEARGLLERGFELLFAQIDQHFEDDNGQLEWLDSLLSFCGRHTVLASEKGWLLMVFKTITSRGGTSGLDSRLEPLIRRILSAGSQNSHELFLSLMEYPAFYGGTLSDFSSLIRTILSSCAFEKTILMELHQCMDHEMSITLNQFCGLSSRRLSSAVSPHCVVCRRPIDKASYVFGCGHVVHMECEGGNRSCPCETDKIGIGRRRIQDSNARGRRFVSPPQRRDIFERWNDPIILTPQ